MVRNENHESEKVLKLISTRVTVITEGHVTICIYDLSHCHIARGHIRAGKEVWKNGYKGLAPRRFGNNLRG